ncbi:MAG: hypothetical protein Q7S80_02650 [bacterium]|nr:hypothetical protein [bacterium]
MPWSAKVVCFAMVVYLVTYCLDRVIQYKTQHNNRVKQLEEENADLRQQLIAAYTVVESLHTNLDTARDTLISAQPHESCG